MDGPPPGGGYGAPQAPQAPQGAYGLPSKFQPDAPPQLQPDPPPVDWVQFIVQGIVAGLKTQYYSTNKKEWLDCEVMSTDDDGGARVKVGGVERTVPKEDLTTRLKGCQKAEYLRNSTAEWCECVVIGTFAGEYLPTGGVKVLVKGCERKVEQDELETRLRKKAEVQPCDRFGCEKDKREDFAPYCSRECRESVELDSKQLCARDLCTRGRRLGNKLHYFCSEACETGAEEEGSYYGSNAAATDRFGGGIGRRLLVNESFKDMIPGTGVSRVCLIVESTGNLKKWATEENWTEVTKLDKAALHDKPERFNLRQEEMLQYIRNHYATSDDAYDSNRIRAGLFRLEDENEFAKLLKTQTIKELPMVVYVGGAPHEGLGTCHVDFANKRLGGGWLCYGFVQEEVMFTKNFDYGALCAKSLLQIQGHDPIKNPVCSPFCMDPPEVWLLRGGHSWAEFGFYGKVPDNWQTEVKLTLPGKEPEETVVAMDAIKADFRTYKRRHLLMMLKKAYTGFVGAKHDGEVGGENTIATGSWGCGVFYNNENVMFVIQALAANLAGVSLTYRVMGDGLPVQDGFALLEDAFRRKTDEKVKPATVSEVLDALVKCCADDDFECDHFHTKYRKEPRGRWLPKGRYPKKHF